MIVVVVIVRLTLIICTSYIVGPVCVVVAMVMLMLATIIRVMGLRLGGSGAFFHTTQKYCLNARHGDG